MAPSTTSSDTALGLLGVACARNTTAELQHEDRLGIIRTARVRLLEMRKDEILADEPVYVDEEDEIPLGAGISVHVLINGIPYQFDSTIVHGRRLIQLNAQQVIPGIALRKPHSLAGSQRRAAHRISMAGFAPTEVLMVRPHAEHASACALDAERVSGLVTGLSAGGISILVDPRSLSRVRRNEQFFLTFTLPSGGEAFCMLGNVRHSYRVEVNAMLRLGLAFRAWRGRHHRYEQLRLSQSLVKLERRQLQRRR